MSRSEGQVHWVSPSPAAALPDSRQATLQGPSAAKGCVTSRAPSTSTSHCPPEAQAPWWSPGIRWNIWALDFQPHVGSREKQGPQKKKKEKQGPQRSSCQANATPPLFTGPQVSSQTLGSGGHRKKKMALKTLPTHHTEQDPLGSLASSGQPHAPSQSQARPGCPEPVEGAPRPRELVSSWS